MPDFSDHPFLFPYLERDSHKRSFQFTRFLFSVEKKNIDTDTIPLENFYRLDF